MAPTSVLIAFCLLSVSVSVHATCTTAENSDVSTCTNTFLTANSAALASVAGTSACEIGASIDCPSGETSVICINARTLTNACRQTLKTEFTNLLSQQNVVCTYEKVIELCPSTTPLNIGVSYPLVSLVSALVYLMLSRAM